jgi:hypothetical protein
VSADPGAAVADEWMRIARKDWRRAERNLKDRDSEAAGFFLQQSIEKYLKAFLLKHNWKLRKIHELDVTNSPMTCCLNASENLLRSLINHPFLSSARHSKLSSKICPNSGGHSKSFNRFASFITGISPFQAFQSFNRFAPFKTFQEFLKLRNVLNNTRGRTQHH